MSDRYERITIGQLLDRAADRFGDDEALVYGDTRLTYKELKQQVDWFAAGLIELGVQKGDTMALWLHNRPEWVISFFAAMKVGAALVPVNTRLRAADLEYVIKQSDSSTMILTSSFRDTSYIGLLQQLCPELKHCQPGQLRAERLPQLRRVIVIDSQPHEGTYSFDWVLELGKKAGLAELRKREQTVDFDDVCLMVYTSGTTGFPKGAMHSHKVIWNMQDAAQRMQYRRGDRLVLYLPLFHVFGAFAGVLLFTSIGGCIILMDVFDPEQALVLMERERATVAYGFDTHFHDMMRVPNFSSFDLSSLRTGLAPLTPEMALKVHKNFTKMSNAYGMTETTSITCCLGPDEPYENFLNYTGRPLPGFEWKVIDPQTGETLPPGQPGELCVRGHPLMLGYYKKPEETAKVIDADGWFHTGDLMMANEEGYLKFVGRLKDIIRVGGENVDPIEVEQFLNSVPGVSQARVVGVPDSRLGEVVAAFIQLDRGASLTKEEVIQACRGQLASFKIPRHVFFVDEFPMTPTGKIQKFKLRDMAMESIQSELGSA